MNIKIENEKKVYVAPAMNVVNMDHEFILCCSGCDDNDDEEEITIQGVSNWYDEFN